jgi:hypothetical protein
MSDSSKLFEAKKIIGKGGGSMNDMIWLVGFVLLYFALQLYILPKLGIST